MEASSTVVSRRAELPAPAEIDVIAAEEAVRTLLKAFGLQHHEEVMLNTPRRVVEAYAQLFTPRPFTATVFENTEQYNELVVVRRIPFRSVCEHHLLPFIGIASVGYVPHKTVVGISKLARAVEFFSSRPQRQERLTVQVAEWLEDSLRPRGVGVMLSAEHACMTLRGARADGAVTFTSAVRGVLEDNERFRSEFMAIAGAEHRRSER